MDSVSLLHLSDLHIGSVLAHNSFGGLSGHHEHDIQLCQGLRNAVRDARKQMRLLAKEKFCTVVSGDISANGLDKEYAMAHTLLRRKFRMYRDGPGKFVGLDLADHEIAVIPGNHDHWDGKYKKQAYNGSLFPVHFRDCPWRITWTSAGGGLTFELFGVDSNSGVTNAVSSWAAQGAVSNQQLAELDKLLAASQAGGSKAVRAITVHHSLSYTRGPLPRVFVPKALDQRSKDELLALSAKHGVAALLTGHTHDFESYEFVNRTSSVTRNVWELRSATTLQGPAAQTGAGFLVHRIDLDNKGKATWSVWRYSWCGSQFLLFDDKNPWVKFETP